jgi:hypothetical protein
MILCPSNGPLQIITLTPLVRKLQALASPLTNEERSTYKILVEDHVRKCPLRKPRTQDSIYMGHTNMVNITELAKGRVQSGFVVASDMRLTVCQTALTPSAISTCNET